MNIGRFVRKVHSKYLKDPNVLTPPWQDILSKYGYHKISLPNGALVHWPDVHVWCKENLGTEHYTWTGNIFWFETEQDAVLFSLRWV